VKNHASKFADTIWLMQNNFLESLKEEKKEISQFLINFLEEQELEFKDQKLHQEIFTEIKAFVVAGKMARGGIFNLSQKVISNQSNTEDSLKVAAALELIHSGLLIHDDIIDQDQKRRGRNSSWYQFKLKAENEESRDAELYGKSLAICTANICYYLANKLINQLKINQQSKSLIAKTINQEIIKVNFAEMLDVDIAARTKDVQLEEILNMYQYKTARYTFSLPLILAAEFHQQNTEIENKLAKIGESLGLIFQIKDDELGIFEEEKTLGKIAASDIKEAKKTIFYFFLKQNLKDKNEQKKFAQIFGKTKLTKEEVEFARAIFKKYAVPEINKIIEQLEKMSKKEIANIADEKVRNLLLGILEFNLQRTY
jgi:geranylgeranyl diphosphate synthase type I